MRRFVFIKLHNIRLQCRSGFVDFVYAVLINWPLPFLTEPASPVALRRALRRVGVVRSDSISLKRLGGGFVLLDIAMDTVYL